MIEETRPVAQRMSHDEYYMNLAIAVREQANCLGSRVGAILVLADRVIATGYNGTPMDMKNCDEGGCDRCLNRENYGSGKAYDVCICVHAEQNLLLTAARFGIAVSGAVVYTTLRPCFGCTKEMIQAGIEEVYFLHDWTPSQEVRHQYELLQYRIPKGIRQLSIEDPKADWAIPKKPLIPDESGHPIPGDEGESSEPSVPTA